MFAEAVWKQIEKKQLPAEGVVDAAQVAGARARARRGDARTNAVRARRGRTGARAWIPKARCGCTRQSDARGRRSAASNAWPDSALPLTCRSADRSIRDMRTSTARFRRGSRRMVDSRSRIFWRRSAATRRTRFAITGRRSKISIAGWRPRGLLGRADSMRSARGRCATSSSRRNDASIAGRCTITRRACARFSNFWMQRGRLKRNPLLGRAAAEAGKALAAISDRGADDAAAAGPQRLLENERSMPFTAWRDRLAMELLYGGGLRVSELVGAQLRRDRSRDRRRAGDGQRTQGTALSVGPGRAGAC